MGNAVEVVTAIGAELRADLVVVSSRGLEPVRRLVLGIVSEGIAHDVDRPVLIAHGSEFARSPTSVVIGEDGSPDAARAVDLAAHFYRALGASATLARTLPEPTFAARRGAILAQAGAAFVGEASLLSPLADASREPLAARAITLTERCGDLNAHPLAAGVARSRPCSWWAVAAWAPPADRGWAVP